MELQRILTMLSLFSGMSFLISRAVTFFTPWEIAAADCSAPRFLSLINFFLRCLCTAGGAASSFSIPRILLARLDCWKWRQSPSWMAELHGKVRSSSKFYDVKFRKGWCIQWATCSSLSRKSSVHQTRSANVYRLCFQHINSSKRHGQFVRKEAWQLC